MIDRLSSPYWQQGVAAAAGCVLAAPILVVAGLPGPALVCMTAAFAVTLALLVATAVTPDEPGASGANDDTRPRGDGPDPDPDGRDPDGGIDWSRFERDVQAYADSVRSVTT